MELLIVWFDVRDVILIDDIFWEGWVQWEEMQECVIKLVILLLEKLGFVLIQGFIGSIIENFIIIFGWEGFDYIVVIFSFCMDVQDMIIWKDVFGVLMVDF